MTLTHLSDDEILVRLRAAREEETRLLARFIVLLVEVEERRLHLRTACPSVYEFCKQELAMSDGAAHRRSIAAQLVRRFPSLLTAIESGALHLSSLCLLRDHLRAENVEELVEACAGKSARQVQELLARRAPRPDVPASMHAIATQASLTASSAPPSTTAPAAAPPRVRDLQRVEALSAGRFELRVTISRELRDKIQRTADLMRHANLDGDLETILDRAVDMLLAKLEKARLRKADRPREDAPASDAGPRSGHVPAAMVRAVFERDGARCTYVDQRGKRCTACTLLEIDHVVPRARGGGDDLENLRVRCRGHNKWWAEACFGKTHVEASIALRRRSWNANGADLARRGLVNLGFKERDAQRAIETVAERHADDAAALATDAILREALRVLT
ncbi:MAG TPA: HNH endonuclease [Labilithrix sp.]